MKSVVTFLFACIAAVMPLAVQAQAADFPNRPIRLIVPFATGGPTDALGRAFAQGLSQRLQQPVIVENRTGVGGSIGAEAVARAVPDGYTLLFATNGPLAANVSLYRKLGYDPLRDFSPISRFAFVPNVIAVNPALPATNLRELIALVKANPTKYSFASGGNGTTQHLGGELLKFMAGIDMQHIPYRGEGPAMADALGGQVPIIFSSLAVGVPQIQSGKLRPMAVTSHPRSPALPDVRTVAEAGGPGDEMKAWYGIVAPAGTPAEIVARLNQASLQVIGSPEIQARLSAVGGIASPGTPEEFAAFIRAEIPRWAKLIQQTGATAD